jgi:hypothetical protein
MSAPTTPGTDAIAELFALVREAGGTVKINGVPIDEKAMRAEMRQRALARYGVADADPHGEALRHLRAVLREVGRSVSFADRGNAPGHCHQQPGIWDSDNRPGRANRRCRWCRVWREATAFAKGEKLR